MRRRWQAWQYLIGIFAAFWVIFAAILIVSELPFYIITIALSTTGMLSLLIIALAWAYMGVLQDQIPSSTGQQGNADQHNLGNDGRVAQPAPESADHPTSGRSPKSVK